MPVNHDLGKSRLRLSNNCGNRIQSGKERQRSMMHVGHWRSGFGFSHSSHGNRFWSGIGSQTSKVDLKTKLLKTCSPFLFSIVVLEFILETLVFFLCHSEFVIAFVFAVHTVGLSLSKHGELVGCALVLSRQGAFQTMFCWSSCWH